MILEKDENIRVYFEILDNSLIHDSKIVEAWIWLKDLKRNASSFVELESKKHVLKPSAISLAYTAKRPTLTIKLNINLKHSGDKFESNSSHRFERGGLHSRIAVFVLGPSAAGKTYMTKHSLAHLLVSNHLPIVPFVSIDGGTMREVSDLWRRMRAECPVDGFKDLFRRHFKDEVGRFKKRVFHSLIRTGVNVVIVDTFADWIPGIHEGKGMHFLKELHAAGYSILMTAIHGTKQRCKDNGRSREVHEGKLYHGKYWSRGVKQIAAAFNRCREMGYRDFSFQIHDNTSFARSVRHIVQPRLGVTIDVRKGTGKSSQYPEGTKRNDQCAVFSSRRLKGITPEDISMSLEALYWEFDGSRRWS